MELIRRSQSRKDSRGKIRQYGIFFCPYCQRFAEKQVHHGIRDMSCGCVTLQLRANSRRRHGEKNTRLYSVWAGIKNRCLNPNDPTYKYYGKRKIKLCREWLNYTPFRDWALANGYTDKLTIDRIDNDGNYESKNCHFIPRAENARKTRRTKLSFAKARQIRIQYATGQYSHRLLGRMYGVSKVNISNIIHNKVWPEQEAV